MMRALYVRLVCISFWCNSHSAAAMIWSAQRLCCMQAPSKDHCLRDEPAASPQPAAAVLEAWLSDATVSLPFDQDPGTAERFTELWAKAFKEVCVLPSLPLSSQGHELILGKAPEEFAHSRALLVTGAHHVWCP